MEDNEVEKLILLIPTTSSKLNPKIFSETYSPNGEYVDKKSIDLGNEIRKYTDILRDNIDSNILPERTGCGNIKLLEMYILNQNNIQEILKIKFINKINEFKSEILEYFTKEFFLQDPPRMVRKTQITKFKKKLTQKYIMDQIKIVLFKWFDQRGIFDMDVELILNGRLEITDTYPRDLIYSHFEELLKNEI